MMFGSRVDRRGKGEQGDHKKTLLFVGRVLEQVRLYRQKERDRGVGVGGGASW